MLKNFWAVVVFTVGIMVCSQFGAMPKVSAADTYIYTENGVDFYYCGFRINLAAYIKGVKDGKLIHNWMYYFTTIRKDTRNGVEFEIQYKLYDRDDDNRIIDSGDVLSNAKAKKAYDLMRADSRGWGF